MPSDESDSVTYRNAYAYAKEEMTEYRPHFFVAFLLWLVAKLLQGIIHETEDNIPYYQ